MDLLWILAVQSTSYAVGAVSWVFAERAGMRAFGLYIAQFARDNRQQTKLLHDRHAREQVEPFLTGETFHTIFRLMYEVESQLKLILALIFNAIVLGVEIDGSLPVAYGPRFAILMALQWSLRQRVAEIYLDNQRWNNRVTAHGYTAWDNVFSRQQIQPASVVRLLQGQAARMPARADPRNRRARGPERDRGASSA